MTRLRAGIFGVGAALPEQVVTNADLEARLDTTDAWIVKRTGIHARRHLNGAQTLADLAAEACADALRDARREPADVDHLIVCTVTPDRVFPGMAPSVAEALGATGCAATDLNAACAGFVYALDHAAALVESRRARLVVVCGAEALSRITDHDDRATAVLFGDGAGAVVVAAGELDRGCAAFALGSDGARGDLLYATREEQLIRMEGREVYRHAVERLVQATGAALRRARCTVADLDLFVAHQANARIVEAAAERLGLAPEQVYVNIDEVANTSSASIPLALEQAQREDRLQPGATIALAAFGAGFSWGAGVMSWKERVHVCA